MARKLFWIRLTGDDAWRLGRRADIMAEYLKSFNKLVLKVAEAKGLIKSNLGTPRELFNMYFKEVKRGSVLYALGLELPVPYTTKPQTTLESAMKGSEPFTEAEDEVERVIEAGAFLENGNYIMESYPEQRDRLAILKCVKSLCPIRSSIRSVEIGRALPEVEPTKVEFKHRLTQQTASRLQERIETESQPSLMKMEGYITGLRPLKHQFWIETDGGETFTCRYPADSDHVMRVVQTLKIWDLVSVTGRVDRRGDKPPTIDEVSEVSNLDILEELVDEDDEAMKPEYVEKLRAALDDPDELSEEEFWQLANERDHD